MWALDLGQGQAFGDIRVSGVANPLRVIRAVGTAIGMLQVQRNDCQRTTDNGIPPQQTFTPLARRLHMQGLAQ
ncbi:hypothetical protein CFII64_14245 [Pseudomonas sp. CFII64]|nr:hypothetical protein CFII64_14245 [Pseudomonas sp. CFII64]